MARKKRVKSRVSDTDVAQGKGGETHQRAVSSKVQLTTNQGLVVSDSQ
jgi:hypothetical protein